VGGAPADVELIRIYTPHHVSAFSNLSMRRGISVDLCQLGLQEDNPERIPSTGGSVKILPVLLILSVVDDLYGDKKRITYWGAKCGLMV